MAPSRRTVLSTAAAGLVTAAANAQTTGQGSPPQPMRPGRGGTDPGPRNIPLELQNPDIFVPPPTDHGTVANLKFPFAASHMRLERGGWTRQVTERELGISKEIAGVNMRLNTGGVRELHWHKAAEWAYMLYGRARITAVDEEGRNFVDDVGVGDLWYFPKGIPHSIQGLEPDGCEFLLVFDDGSFSEDNTFLLSDWFKHMPPDVLGKNFGVPGVELRQHAGSERALHLPAASAGAACRRPHRRRHAGAEHVQPSPDGAGPDPHQGGSVRIVDSKNFPASVTIAAALVEIDPGAMRELHWHPNTDEWQYYIEGKGRMGVFASSGDARTFDYQAGDVGFVPFAMGHYIENTGDTPLRFLEMFKSSYYADVSLNRWMALTPPELVQGTLKLDRSVMSVLRKGPAPVVPV